MLLPGVSGGTCAIILGIYDRLITSVSEITKRKNIRQNITYLALVAFGGLVGALLFSFLLTKLLEMWGYFLSFLFIGAVAGTFPILIKQSGVEHFQWKDVLFAGVGTAVSLVITLFPKNMLQIESITGISDLLLLFVAGFAVSIALVLPGISVSYTLLILGIYERMVYAVSTFDIIYIAPIAAGCFIGIFAVTRFLDYLISKYRRAMYMIIAGFVVSCIPRIFERLPRPDETILCIILLLTGFVLIYSVCKATKTV